MSHNDSEHRTSVKFLVAGVRRAECTCGWHGQWHQNADAGWQALCDGDDHYNQLKDE